VKGDRRVQHLGQGEEGQWWRDRLGAGQYKVRRGSEGKKLALGVQGEERLLGRAKGWYMLVARGYRNEEGCGGPSLSPSLLVPCLSPEECPPSPARWCCACR